MKRSNSFLSPFEHTSLIVLYVLIALAVFIAGWYGLGVLMDEPGAFYALYIILFLFAAALTGAYLWVLVTLPKGLSAEFDDIKNRIASGEIAGIKDFSDEFSAFLVKFFTFFRFDVVVAVVKIKGHRASFSPVDTHVPAINPEELSIKSREGEEVSFIGKFEYENQKLYGYLVPIWFGGDWLGYFAVYTDSKLYGIFRLLLKNFEEQYIDDQLMHVLHRDNLSHVRHLCADLETLSGKINREVFTSIEIFQDDLLDIILQQTGCKAGIIKSVFSKEVSCRGVQPGFIDKLTLPQNDKTINTSDDDLPRAMVKWVTGGELLAVIVLLDTGYEAIIRSGAMLENCLVIRIAQYFTSLEHKLALQRLMKLK